ncbi:hypothetical protein ACYX34_00970 [Nitrospira sp. CMX1]|nr:hypothetical protein [Nitrospira sp.]
MSSITTWSRLEPNVRGASQQETLKARIYDPLWLLARQWQLGELQGDDNGTPVSARLRAECAELTRYLPKNSAAKPVKFDPKKVPLETFVEREAVHPQPGTLVRLRVIVEAGQHFLRLMARAPYGTKYHQGFLAAFPLPTRSEALAADVDTEAQRFLAVMSGRVPDGVTLYGKLKNTPLPTTPVIDLPDAGAFATTKDAFIRWYEALFSEPTGQAEAWSPQRMEYAFSVEAPTSPPRVLTSDYYDGELDWYDFDVKMGETLGANEDRTSGVNPLPITRTTIPAPVTYRGMPASRWWEFEDASVDFGAVESDPDDLARMLLVDFAITYGNDWFVIPVDVPVGSICRIHSLVITDTFGVRTLIPSIDRSTHPASSHWRMFKNSGNADTPTNLFLAPTLKRTMESQPLDDVLFLRDEMANLAWGVERIAEGASGRPLNRRDDKLARRTRNQPSTSEPSSDGALTWRLSTEVPGYWIPLIPVQIQGNQHAIRLRRGTVLRQDGSLKPQPAISQILKPSAGPLDIFEEEIPREGARVTRSFQYARWFNGSPLLWIGRRKTVGRGEGSSGLRFDVAE